MPFSDLFARTASLLFFGFLAAAPLGVAAFLSLPMMLCGVRVNLSRSSHPP